MTHCLRAPAAHLSVCQQRQVALQMRKNTSVNKRKTWGMIDCKKTNSKILSHVRVNGIVVKSFIHLRCQHKPDKAGKERGLFC